MWNVLRQLVQKSLGNTVKLPASNSTQSQLYQPFFNSIQIQKSLSTTSYKSAVVFSTTTATTNYNVSNPNMTLTNSSSTFLTSPPPIFGGLVIIPSRGMKIKGRVKRRCKDCYLIWIDGLLHNKCKAHPRHTQMQKPKYWANTRILTHATMSPKRPW